MTTPRKTTDERSDRAAFTATAESSSAPPDDAYPVAPAHADPADRIRGATDEFARPIARRSLDAEDRHYSLVELCALVTVFAIVLGLLRLYPLPVFAGVFGFLTLAALGILQLLGIRRAILRLGWWLMLAVYLICAVLAVRGG